MNVGVTAASGHLGQEILTALCAEIGADNVIAIARSPDKIHLDGIEIRTADYQSEQQCTDALQDIDSVIMISAPVGPEGQDRVQLHRNVIAGAKQAGVRKLSFTSVIGNGLEQESLYWPVAQVNRQAEEDVKNSGLAWVIGRNGLYLEFDVAHIVRAGREDGIFRNNGGTGHCGYITRDELAYAWAKIATDDRHNRQTYNLVTDCRTQAELVAMVNAQYGLSVVYESISDDECTAKLEPVRGREVALMLTGCYQCIRVGAYDVPSDYEQASGRPPKTVAEMVANYASHAESS